MLSYCGGGVSKGGGGSSSSKAGGLYEGTRMICIGRGATLAKLALLDGNASPDICAAGGGWIFTPAKSIELPVELVEDWVESVDNVGT